MNVLKLDAEKLFNAISVNHVAKEDCKFFVERLHVYLGYILKDNLFLNLECINMWHRGFSVDGSSLYALRTAITATDEYNLDHAIITDDACKEIVDWFKCKLTQIPEWCDYYGITPSPSEASKPAEEVQAIFLTRVAERDAELDRIINKHKSDTIIQRYKAPRIRLLEHDSRLNDIYHPEEASLISAFRFDIKRNLVTLFNNTYSDIRSDDGC